MDPSDSYALSAEWCAVHILACIPMKSVDDCSKENHFRHVQVWGPDHLGEAYVVLPSLQLS